MEMTRERRIILIVGAVLLLAGGIYRFYPAMEGYFPSGDLVVAKAEKVNKYRRMVAERREVVDRLKETEQRLTDIESGLFQGRTPALTAAAIQNTLTRIAGEVHVEIGTIGAVDAGKVQDQPYIAIPVQLTFTAAIDELGAFLYGIQSGPKLLRVSDIRIQTAGHGRSETFRTSLTVTGYAKAPETEEP